jgi:hypothetical protein
MKLKLSISNWIQLLAPHFFAILFLFFAKNTSEEVNGIFASLINLIYQFINIFFLPEGNITYLRCLVVANFYIVFLMIGILIPWESKEKTGRSFKTKHATFDEYRTVTTEPYVPESYIYFIIITFHILIVIFYVNTGKQVEYSTNDTKSIDSISAPINNEAISHSNFTESVSVSEEVFEPTTTNDKKYNIGQELDGGIIFQLNNDSTHGLIFYDNRNLLGLSDAKNWISEKNFRLPNIVELSLIVDNYNVFKDGCCFWSSEFANDINEKRNYKILCKTLKIDDKEVSIEEYDFIKCYNSYDQSIVLIQSDCNSYICQTIGIANF